MQQSLNRAAVLFDLWEMRARVRMCSSKDCKSFDRDPPERMVLTRGRKQVCCVGPCSRSLRGMAGRRGQRRRVKHGGNTDMGVVLSFPLSHETQFFIETFQCAYSHSINLPWCCNLCHGGQGYPQMPHLVCQACLPAHCSPSSLNLLPFCHCCLPSTHPAFHSEP